MLTAAERRGALILALLMALGTGWDVWQAHRPVRGLPARLPEPESPVPPGGASGADSGERVLSAPPVSRKLAAGQRIDVNRAAAAELLTLPGIGPVLAARIVEARRERGSFARLEDLLTVRGIGPRLFERLRPHLRLGGPAGARAAPGALRTHAFRTAGPADSVQILLQSRTPAFR